MSYILQILHGSSYRYSEQITKVKTYKKYISTHNSAIFWATDSRFCMEVGHQLLVQKSELGRGFRDFRPCSFPCTIFQINKMINDEVYLHYVHMIFVIIVKLVKKLITMKLHNNHGSISTSLSYVRYQRVLFNIFFIVFLECSFAFVIFLTKVTSKFFV